MKDFFVSISKTIHRYQNFVLFKCLRQGVLLGNGICLCALHHTAYDRSLIFFDQEFNIHINESKMEYLEKLGLDSGFRKFEALAFDKIQLPLNQILHPNIENIKLANQARGIV